MEERKKYCSQFKQLSSVFIWIAKKKEAKKKYETHRRRRRLNEERQTQRGESESEAEKEAESFRHFSEFFFLFCLSVHAVLEESEVYSVERPKDDMYTKAKEKKEKSCGEHSLFRWFSYILNILQIRANPWINILDISFVYTWSTPNMQNHRSIWNSVVWTWSSSNDADTQNVGKKY